MSIQEAALPPFVFSSGYELSFADLGNIGVKIEMSHSEEVSGAIILPMDKVDELNLWLQCRIGIMRKKPGCKRVDASPERKYNEPESD